MALLPIVKVEHPVLRKKAVKVISFDKKFQQLVDDMIETMIDAPGVGLAAPQVNVSQRLIVVRLPDDEESKSEYGDQAGVVYVVANPKIIKASKEMVDGVEACLSLPGYYGDVERHETIVITGQDRYGKEFRLKAKGWQARVFQHEIDHLDGIMYTDIAKDVWKAKDGEEIVEGETPKTQPEN
ncbi:MAG TPA: peptide deformylase [Aggregatilineales bacterium]|nr:peptide deformylase [Aggregatilineales bacterium]